MRLFATIAFVITSITCSAQSISKKIIDYYTSVPQEKIYLHTDKSNYIAGDSVWFRGYLTNAVTNRQSLLSYYMYVDLIDNFTGKTIQHSMIICDSIGAFYNNIPLPKQLLSGAYRIVAYTSYMRNFPQEYFFSKTIQVKGFDEQKDNMPKHKRERPTTTQPFSIDVMPEGGQLIADNLQKLAYKAIGNKGLGVDVEVKITDDEGRTIAEGKSQHLGMGSISFTPMAGRIYTLTATTTDGKTKSVRIPDVLGSGITLAAVQHNGSLNIKAIHTPDVDVSKYALVIHGSLNIATGEDIRKKEFKIPMSNLHEGVTLISLIEKSTNKIVAERAVFIRNLMEKDSTLLAFTHKKGERRGLVKTTISAPKGWYSLSVTDKDSAPLDSLHDNIVSSLLLSSEIKGNIENPQYYFNSITPKTDNDLDLLMLTQAWRRYDISDILNNVKPECKFPIEQSQAIEGSIGGIWKKDMKTPSLLVMCGNPRMLQIIDLSTSGRFTIDGLHFADSTKFLISALNHKGKTSFMDLQINEPSIPNIGRFDNVDTSFADSIDSWAYKLRYSHLNKQWLVELPDLEVRGYRREKPINPYGITPDKAYNADDDWLKSCNSMEDVFFMLNAPIAEDVLGRLTFPGVVYVNDFPYERDFVNDLMPDDIARIEYIRRFNGATMMFSDRDGDTKAANDYGVIIIKLKDPDSYPTEKTGKHAFATKMVMPLGYKQEVEFYAPRYDTPERLNEATTDVRTTVYWNPTIRIGDDGKAELEFYTPDNPVNLQFDLQGLGEVGPSAFSISEGK